MSGSEAAVVPRRYRAALERLGAAQKPGGSNPAYLRWVNRPLGRRAAALAYRLGLSPNAVTAVSAVLSLAALLLIAAAPPSLTTAIGAAVLLLAGYALDSADGQLARLTGTGSLAGEWLDHVVDAARPPLLHLAIAVHFFREDQSLWLVGAALLFLVLTSVWFFAQTLAEKLTPEAKPVEDAPAWVSWAKTPYDVGTLYLTVFTLALPALFTTLYLLLLAITLAVAALSLRRKYHALATVGAGKRAAEVPASGTPAAVPLSD